MNWKTWHLIVIIFLIIIVLPPLLTLSAFWFDFSKTGEIGDTIGGITAPFINGLAAVLVFIAFKEQVNANKLIVRSNELLKTNEMKREILEMISHITKDFTDLKLRADRLSLQGTALRQTSVPSSMMDDLNYINFLVMEYQFSIQLLDDYIAYKRQILGKSLQDGEDYNETIELNTAEWAHLKLRLTLLFEILHKDIFIDLQNSIEAQVNLGEMNDDARKKFDIFKRNYDEILEGLYPVEEELERQ